MKSPYYNIGFTLVEVLAALFLFSVIMIMVTSVFVQSLAIQRRASNIQQAEESASYVLESMTKEIRVSDVTDPSTDNDCKNGPSYPSLTILHPDHGEVKFSVLDGNIIRQIGAESTVMNSNTVKFTNLGFCLTGFKTKDGNQPRVTILTTVQSANAKTQDQTQISTQTSISLRTLID